MTQTPMKDNQLKLVWKTLKQWKIICWNQYFYGVFYLIVYNSGLLLITIIQIIWIIALKMKQLLWIIK